MRDPALRRALPHALALAVAGLLLAGWSHTTARQPAAPTWEEIPGPAGTRCSLGSPYRFFVHRGSDRRVAVYFQGGGACWNGGTCDVKGQPSFDRAVDSSDDPARAGGLFELSNPANPIRDYTIVFAPYCTGDVFVGARTVKYEARGAAGEAARAFEIHHEGLANAEAVLAWVYAHVPGPDLVFVSGSSAGAIATPVFAAEIADHYRNARVVQLGDSAGAYRTPTIGEILATWGAADALAPRHPAYRRTESARLNFEAFYAESARETPRVTFAESNTVDDQVQLRFLRLVGVNVASPSKLLAANLADVRRANPRFRSYTAPGGDHTILAGPTFYTVKVDDVLFRDWVAVLLRGDAAPDVGSSLLTVSSDR